MAAPFILAETPVCRVEIEDRQSEGIVFRPVGQIDEDFNFGTVLKQMFENFRDRKAILFDLGEVKRINSCGLREWLLFLEQLRAKFQISFLVINQTIIEQASVVPNVVGRAGTRIEAFKVPFVCDSCKNNFDSLIHTDDIQFKGTQPQFPKVFCPACKAPATLDALESEHFEFLKNLRR